MCLYASHIDGRGTNKFEESGVTFGWEPIEDMLHREVQRKKNNQLPRVPGLKENHVFHYQHTTITGQAKLLNLFFSHKSAHESTR